HPALSLVIWSVLGAGGSFLLCSFLPIWSSADPARPILCRYEFRTLAGSLYSANPWCLVPDLLTLEGFWRYHRILALSSVVLAGGMKLGWMLNQRHQRNIVVQRQHRRALALCLCLVVLLTSGLLLDYWLWESRAITPDQCARIKEGMSLEEVE